MKQNPEQEFLTLYESEKDKLFRHILFRIAGERERATDLLSECFTRTWSALVERAKKGENIENLRAYLYRVAHNLIVDEYGRPKTSSLDELHEESEFDVASEGREAQVGEGAEIAELKRALEKLPQDFREVLVMRYLDDMGPGEIAEILGENANTVSVRLGRAQKALKEILNPTVIEQ